MTLAIDPGNIESGYSWIDEAYKPVRFGKVPNKDIYDQLYALKPQDHLVIEMVACYGMPAGASLFDTCVWIGCFKQYAEYVTGLKAHLMPRKDVKMQLCGQTRAKDANVIQALVDRFSEPRHASRHGKGTKKDPGFFYGFAKDIWQAYALGVTYIDQQRGKL
ncbi:MAG: hypothetical protein NE327_10635 [Lentisphaeraceae bacterium]|nr:hypothetical protein [Lentisphaeraceae bacterium]